MALVRILVDGYSLLHYWRELAPGKARHSVAARDELIHRLTQYRDAIRIPISIVFDGAGAPGAAHVVESTPELEILFSGPGHTADDLIERVVARLRDFGEVVVVTDDHAERETVLAMGGLASSCFNFVQDVNDAIREQQIEVSRHNREERSRFKLPPKS